jgi:hypothetical protein
MSKTNTKRAVLSLESLAARDVPAVLVTGNVLEFTGTAGADYFEVEDSGAAAGSNVRFRTNPNFGFTPVAQHISVIDIDTGGGIDTVKHTITGNLVGGPRRLVTATLGDADDEFVSTVNGTIVGNSPAGLTLNVSGGNGGDEITGRLNGDIHGSASVRYGFFGGGDPGCDFMNVFLDNDVDIGPDASFDANVLGGLGNDNIELRYRGQLDGSLNFDLDGQWDSDWVRADVTLDAYSHGNLGSSYYDPAAVRGGYGDRDTVEFVVVDNSVHNPPVFAGIAAGIGDGNGTGVGPNDRRFHTANVRVLD